MIDELNEYEMKLVTDPEVILTKNKIIAKVCELFGRVVTNYKEVIKNEHFLLQNEKDAKISKGENYEGLPYIMLDYPRQFGTTDILAIRSFFWWGNFFSITIQLSGEHHRKYLPKIKKAAAANLLKEWYVGVGETPWQHHFEDNNYKPIEQEMDDKFFKGSFIKIAKKIPLRKWDEAEIFFKENFLLLIKIINS